jgi:hypothetical protein
MTSWRYTLLANEAAKLGTLLAGTETEVYIEVGDDDALSIQAQGDSLKVVIAPDDVEKSVLRQWVEAMGFGVEQIVPPPEDDAGYTTDARYVRPIVALYDDITRVQVRDMTAHGQETEWLGVTASVLTTDDGRTLKIVLHPHPTKSAADVKDEMRAAWGHQT